MARFVIREEVLDDVDTEQVLRNVAEEIAADARRIVAVRSSRTKLSIRVAAVSKNHAVIVADPKNPRSSPSKKAYGAHLERGTSDTRAQPFMRPAGYRYRTP